MSRKDQTIAIIGAGPGGLCLARILWAKGGFSSVTVYESETSPAARTQGGSLDLHTDTGQRALQAAGISDQEFRQYVQVAADALTIVNEHDAILYRDQGGNGSRPEIERTDLRAILLRSLPPNMIQWDRKLIRVEAPPADGDEHEHDQRIQLIFHKGPTERCDFVVGADGAWSKVRAVLTNVSPVYTGVSFWELNLPKQERRSNGTMFALDEKGGVLIAHFNSHATHVYVGCKSQQGQLPQIHDVLRDWAPELQSIANHTDHLDLDAHSPSTTTPPSKMVCRELYALPLEKLRWMREQNAANSWKNRVAIIGDAAHLMSPMAGEGVNLALADAADLAAVMIKGDSVATFEQGYMFRRAQRAAQESHDNLRMFFFHNGSGAQAVAQQMRNFTSLQNILIYAQQWIKNWWEDMLWTIGWRVPALGA